MQLAVERKKGGSGRIFMKKLKQSLLLMCIISMTGCSYLGGVFDRNKCKGGDCESESLLKDSTANQKWYCYGKQGSSEWQCENTRDAGKIAAIVPEATPPDSGYRTNRTLETVPEAPSEPVVQQSVAESEQEPGQIPTELTAESIIAPNSLQDHPREAYAVQLLAMQDEEKILNFAETNGITKPLYTRISNQGREWFVLLLGIYPDRHAAIEAKETWVRTRSLETEPWIRLLGPLQDAAQSARDG
ncbi:MAG TPA: hypothetical protein EYQ14_08005 [Gammaproteobacteria bacterium]|nr:hypothetical protein [Gammaproteobacteria bacterium]HIL95097.1 hypothetical protein [Pseudomonadales bacterium]